MQKREKMYRPKYLWLSYIAFFIISYQCRTEILHGSKKVDYTLWYRYIGFELLWGCITLFMPAGVIAMLNYIFSAYSNVIELVINILGLIYLYFGGVILSFKLHDWRIKNIKKIF